MHTGNMPHALLFSGMPGIGKAVVARELAKLLNCLDPHEGDCCDRCSSCRKIDASIHPDFLWITNEGTFIKIDQIRELRSRLKYRPFEGKWRSVVIEGAQNLKEEASNALLKLLEEPPGQNIFMLLVLEPQMLLPTIVSRCCHIRFQPLDINWIERHLIDCDNIPMDRARTAARLADGSLDRARALAQGALLDHWRETIEKMRRIKELSMIDFFSFVAQWVQKSEDLEQDLECIKLWVRDLVFSRLMLDYRPALETESQLAGDARSSSVESLFTLYDQIEHSMQRLRLNANKQMTLESLCLAIKEGL